MLSKAQLFSNTRVESFSILCRKLLSNVTLSICGFLTPNAKASPSASSPENPENGDSGLTSSTGTKHGKVGRPVKISPFYTLKAVLLMGLSGVETIGHFMRVDMARQFDLSQAHVYRFLNDTRKNWRKLIHIVSKSALRIVAPCYPEDKFNAFIVDDTVYHRRSKKVELGCKVYDHVSNRTEKGFTLLNLAIGNSRTALPIDSVIISSADEKKQLRPADKRTDWRSHGGQSRRRAMMSKIAMTTAMIRDALKRGFKADKVLMDSWFGCNNTLIWELHDMGLNVVAMAKDFSQRFRYNGQVFYLPELRVLLKPAEETCKASQSGATCTVVGQMLVGCEPTKAQLDKNPHLEPLPVRLIWLKSYTENKELVLITTDTEATLEQTIMSYSARFNIEENFFNLKHFLHMESGSRARSFDTIRSHVALCLIRLLLLTVMKVGQERMTFGDAVYVVGEEVKVKPLSQAIERIFQSLMELPEKLIASHCIVKGKEREVMEIVVKALRDIFNGFSQYVLSFIGDIADLLSP